MSRRESNAKYYQRTRDRIIIREDELTPSTIEALLDCLTDLDHHPAGKRVARLRQLYVDITGHEAPTLGEPS